MYNVNNNGSIQYGGWNVVDVDDEPKDNTLQLVARLHNDKYFVTCMNDFRKDVMKE